MQRIITAEEVFHFSEVGSGKTKVILPLLCQAFLSNNAETHHHLARGGQPKHVLVVMVPEHLVADARTQVFRYCLNLNFREEYRIYDVRRRASRTAAPAACSAAAGALPAPQDIMALLHPEVQLRPSPSAKRAYSGYPSAASSSRPPMKQIFITSFNQFKKALTYDVICEKVRPMRERMLVVLDEVDDFLDRDKLVFNICSNKANAFAKPTLECYYAVSKAVYHAAACPEETVGGATNPDYWRQLHDKFGAIHLEIQDKSKSINKSFGIFNAQTLRHCVTNVAQDIEGYKSLIARPYESVNRAMPGSHDGEWKRASASCLYRPRLAWSQAAQRPLPRTWERRLRGSEGGSGLVAASDPGALS